MKIQYVLEPKEVKKSKDRLRELKQIALMSRDVGDMEANREYYLMAKGFDECMQILGIVDNSKERK